MSKNNIHSLIKEIVSEELIKESLISLDGIHDGISTSTMVGEPWSKMVNSLEAVINEVKDFRSMYSPAFHGPMPNTEIAYQRLQEVIKLLTEIKPVILGMDDIQKKDV